MDGYDSSDLSGMVQKITSGATGALSKIEMTGYTSDNISSAYNSTEEAHNNIINELGLIGMYDVNMDGIINVIDVVTLVNCILGLNNIGQEYDEYYMACASGTGSYIPPTTTYGCGGCVGNGLVDEVDSNGLCCGPGDL